MQQKAIINYMELKNNPLTQILHSKGFEEIIHFQLVENDSLTIQYIIFILKGQDNA